VPARAEQAGRSCWYGGAAVLVVPAVEAVPALQARGITMKSSSIGLLHIPGAAGLPGSSPVPATAQDKLDKGAQLRALLGST